jgi:large subunit ribosomal protein L32e
MADEEEPATPSEASPAPARRRSKPAPASAAQPEAKASPAPAKKSDAKPAPRRPTLDPETKRLLQVRDDLSGRRPKFVRTASNRYWRIGRWNSWRAPRGLQSKQRRHYGYRPRVVRIGYGSPRATRNRTPTGFIPILVRTDKDLKALDAAHEAAVIARTVGTRRRLTLEETCRKLGIHVLNPIVKDREAT